MTRSNRPSAAAVAHNSHAQAPHARARRTAHAWNARACDLRTAATTGDRIDRIIVQRSRNATQ
eukprot:36875-Lingulodinium_polyedra.AAC.1